LVFACFSFLNARMSKRKAPPAIALTIAGSDSGGGAGIQADLGTFAALGVHGTSAITCLTAQNPAGVRAIWPSPPGIVQEQIEAVFEVLPPVAAKTGMLHSRAIIKAVASALSGKNIPLVIDPVMVATSGARLLRKDAVAALESDLIPLAALVTPNLAEAEVFLGRRIVSPDDLRAAARDLSARWGCAVLAKGGHLPGVREAVDIFCDGRREVLHGALFVRGGRNHGTGCVYSAAIAAGLAQGQALSEAVARAKELVTRAIAETRRFGPWRLWNFFPAIR
jgi:hydroxymethylpyrimidine/phosphomethylpyrimidine kinase